MSVEFEIYESVTTIIVIKNKMRKYFCSNHFNRYSLNNKDSYENSQEASTPKKVVYI
jgi:hypothetical protein